MVKIKLPAEHPQLKMSKEQQTIVDQITTVDEKLTLYHTVASLVKNGPDKAAILALADTHQKRKEGLFADLEKLKKQRPSKDGGVELW